MENFGHQRMPRIWWRVCIQNAERGPRLQIRPATRELPPVSSINSRPAPHGHTALRLHPVELLSAEAQELHLSLPHLELLQGHVHVGLHDAQVLSLQIRELHPILIVFERADEPGREPGPQQGARS